MKKKTHSRYFFIKPFPSSIHIICVDRETSLVEFITLSARIIQEYHYLPIDELVNVSNLKGEKLQLALDLIGIKPTDNTLLGCQLLLNSI